MHHTLSDHLIILVNSFIDSCRLMYRFWSTHVSSLFVLIITLVDCCTDTGRIINIPWSTHVSRQVIHGMNSIQAFVMNEHIFFLWLSLVDYCAHAGRTRLHPWWHHVSNHLSNLVYSYIDPCRLIYQPRWTHPSIFVDSCIYLCQLIYRPL